MSIVPSRETFVWTKSVTEETEKKTEFEEQFWRNLKTNVECKEKEKVKDLLKFVSIEALNK